MTPCLPWVVATMYPGSSSTFCATLNQAASTTDIDAPRESTMESKIGQREENRSIAHPDFDSVNKPNKFIISSKTDWEGFLHREIIYSVEIAR